MNILGFKNGNAIVRQYNNLKIGVQIKRACATSMFTIGALSARHREPVTTIMGGVLSCMYIKEASELWKRAQILKPQVNAIIKRARQIKKATK